MMIRARTKTDIDNMCKLYSKLFVRKTDVVEIPYTDYAYRIIVEKKEWLDIAEHLANDIDYSNFKNEMHKRNDARLNRALSNVWASMYALQEE